MRVIFLALGLLSVTPGAAGVEYAWDAASAVAQAWPAAAAGPALQASSELTIAEDFGRQVVRGSAFCPEPLGAGWSQLTLSVVLRVAKPAGTWQGIAGRDRPGGSAGDAWSLLLDPQGAWAGRLATAQGRASLSAPATAGWHQVALTYDGATARLVVDGQSVAEAALTGQLVEESGTPFTVGAYADGALPFQGELARVELRDDSPSAETLAAAWTAWQAEHASKDGFWFAQASDIHLTDTRSVEIVNRAVDAINADPRLQFSLWLGDLTRGSTPDEMVLARLALDRLQQPRYTLRGNHDQTPGVYEAQFGLLNQAFEAGGWKFILLDTNPGDKTPVSDDHVAWLREQIAATSAEMPIILCTHHPLMPHTKSYRLAGSDELLALFAGHNLKAVLSGHFHGNQEEVVDGVLFTTTQCLSSTRGNHDGTEGHGYRVFHCRDGAISSEFVPTE